MMAGLMRAAAAAAAGLALLLAWQAPVAAATAKAPEATQHDYTIKDFRFQTGETLPEVKIHNDTRGAPRRDAAGHVTNAVLLLHGTGGSGHQFAAPQFADVLLVPGGLLDPARYFIIMPDGIGHGGSSRPSDGLRMKFPKYDYADMVTAQHELTTKGLGVEQLRLIMGTSMGCMHIFVWAEAYPAGAKALMPLACLPVELAGRNRLWRAMSIDAIEADPAWQGGDYKTEPKMGLLAAENLLILAGAAPLNMQKTLPTRDAVDAYAAKEPPVRVATAEANDMIYQLDASRTYNPSPNLAKITAPMTWVNSTDDFINPPELGIAQREARRVKTARFVLIQATPETHGHGTHTWAVFWKDELAALLKRSE
jgi:homoserine O-acetyltransferase